MKTALRARRRDFLREGSALAATALGAVPAWALPAPITTVFHHPDCARHDPGRGHPEQSARVDAVLNAMRVLDRQGAIALTKGRHASEAELELVHARDYVELVKREAAAGPTQLSTGDVMLSADSFKAATAAAGCVLAAVDAVMTGAARNAFCAVRPPGHHASATRGMGFCLFNNIALAARHAQRRHGVSRVLIADWDVHHGNGTQEVFWRDGSVLFFDTHIHPHYPGSGAREEAGEGSGQGLIMNRPFPRGAGREEILGAFRDELVPAAERFKPELVLVSAGFDSRADDPLGGFRLSDGDFADLTDIVTGIAARHAQGRLVSALEGGYPLNGLSAAAAAHVRRLSAA